MMKVRGGAVWEDGTLSCVYYMLNYNVICTYLPS